MEGWSAGRQGAGAAPVRAAGERAVEAGGVPQRRGPARHPLVRAAAC